MAISQIINVIVNPQGAVTVKRQLGEIGEAARTTTTYLNGLRAILASALTFSGVQGIMEAIDQYTQLTNRLRLVASANETVTQSWDRLLKMANSSYSTIDSTVNLYFRVAQAYKAWGESAQKAYEFTELFQQAAILSGSSMQTTAQAVYQFGQALNKGKLDGDEFRSVLEGLPYVANLIQKELGVTRAELYKMSEDGKISLDRIKRAFESAAKKIKADWGSVTPTLGMALNIFRNQWIDFVGDVQNSTGIFSIIAQGIILVANNFHLLMAALTPVVASLGFLAGRLVLGLVVTGIRDMAMVITRIIPIIWAWNASLLANPIVAIGTAIAGIIVTLIYFKDEIIALISSSTMLQAASGVASAIVALFSPLGDLIGKVIDKFKSWLPSWEQIKKAASDVGGVISAVFTRIMNGAVAVANYVAKAFLIPWLEFKALLSEIGGLFAEVADMVTNNLGVAIKDLGKTFKPVWDLMQPALQETKRILKDIWEGWKILGSYLQNTFGGIVKDVFDGWIIILREVIDVVRRIVQALREAVALMKAVGGGMGGGGGVGANYGFQGYAGEFNSGGGFKVGGTGAGRDTTPVSFRANRGERVTVETKRQQRMNDNYKGSEPANVNVPVGITNVLDMNMIPAANESLAGQRSIINAIKFNRDEIALILGAG